MTTRAIAVAVAALALSAGAYAVEPAKGGSASGAADQAEGKGSEGTSSAAQPAEQGTGSASAEKDPATTEKDPAARAKETPQMQSVVGVVEKLEGDSLTVKSSPLSDPHELKLGADTKFLRDGESISRDELSEGDQIRASFAGDSETATEVSVIRKGAGKLGETQVAPGSSGAPAGETQATPKASGSSGTR
jgi:hypothetical protein